MSNREYLSWRNIILVTLGWALLMIVIPPTVIFSPIAVEILGSMIGFILAISFTELIKLNEKKNRAKKIEDDIRGEISEIIELVEKTETMISFDIWEMAVSTGDVGLLNSDTRRLYSEFYRYVRYRRWLREAYLQFFGPENGQKDLEVHRKLSDINRQIIKLAGPLILEKTASLPDQEGIAEDNNI